MNQSDLIGREVYCIKVGEANENFVRVYGHPRATLPTVGKLYTIRSVCQYEGSDYPSVALNEIVNSPIGGNPFLEGSGVEPHFPISWFGDINSATLSEAIEELLKEPILV